MKRHLDFDDLDLALSSELKGERLEHLDSCRACRKLVDDELDANPFLRLAAQEGITSESLWDLVAQTRDEMSAELLSREAMHDELQFVGSPVVPPSIRTFIMKIRFNGTNANRYMRTLAARLPAGQRLIKSIEWSKPLARRIDLAIAASHRIEQALWEHVKVRPKNIDDLIRCSVGEIPVDAVVVDTAIGNFEDIVLALPTRPACRFVMLGREQVAPQPVAALVSRSPLYEYVPNPDLKDLITSLWKG